MYASTDNNIYTIHVAITLKLLLRLPWFCKYPIYGQALALRVIGSDSKRSKGASCISNERHNTV
jgi:hypothetical protein